MTIRHAYLLSLLALSPLPHPGPPIWSELQILDEEVLFTFSGEPEPLAECLGIELELVGPLDESDHSAAVAAFEDRFRAERPLRIDGEPVDLVLRELEIPVDDVDEEGWLQVHARFAVAVEHRPSSVSITWNRYDGAVWSRQTFIPITIIDGQRVEEIVSVHPDEPEFVWHAKERRARPIAPVVVDVEPASFRLPLVSLALGVASIAAYASLRRSRRGLSALVGLGGLLVAAALRDVGTFELASPLRRAVAIPSSDQALAVFETLHRNVYDAFDAETEEGIYEVLAVSVDAAILDELYGDVYESLILRDDGGAVCSIDSVEVLSRAARFPDGADDERPRFLVDWGWRVDGIVAHWGHIHRRRNEYEAEYTVRHDGQSWKIAAVNVIEHRRVDLPPESPPMPVGDDEP